MRINYEKLVAEYHDSMFTKLRGFGAESGFLDTWVPDADTTKSLCNILDAAALAGHPDLDIFIGSETATQLDLSMLVKTAGAYGSASTIKEDDGFLLTVINIQECTESENNSGKGVDRTGKFVHVATNAGKSWARDWASKQVALPSIEQVENIGDLYDSAIKAAGNDITFEGAIDSAEAEGALNGVRLSLQVDAENHTITAAKHSGTTTQTTRALLDVLCGLITGLPILEASDHGMIRLEFQLRDKTTERPVPGIVSPEAADPAFLLPLKLIRKALRDYRKASGFSDIENTYDPSPSEKWLEMNEEQRISTLNRIIAVIAKENGFNGKDVRVTAIEFDVRVVIIFQGDLEHTDKQRHIMILEQGIKSKLDSRLELFQEEIKDINKLRRLSQQASVS